MDAATDHALMEGSLEALAEVTEDLTPPVYARFFARHPETQPLFVDELGRGRMLYEIIQTCLELAEERHQALFPLNAGMTSFPKSLRLVSTSACGIVSAVLIRKLTRSTPHASQRLSARVTRSGPPAFGG